ncbi:receptor-like protein kinase FERONIA [Rhododendron vialii]|uniref:receptor-like protein kinase FERONIA n=1 Tax=Rhododendron vialii TaxID=182163 RepID=UPI00265E18B5|nr:receptor-like protein kinase FERONIA [Rhododendron vialii]XP_058187730.1 receptor-like protein kinase FERONIA [Rhododendron vialii]
MSVCYARVLVLAPLFFFLPHILSITVNIPTPYAPVDNLAINCGSLGNSTTRDGRGWTGDIGSKFSQLLQGKSKSLTSKAFHQFSDTVHPVPYMTARISRSQFSYTFKVNPGQKFIRLHFHPVSYPGFKRSSAIFTVKAGRYILLSNFSASLTADALGLRCFVKEFCLNAGESPALTISFFPSPSSPSEAAYAFINGIEIVSMPTGLYYTQGNDPGAFVVGQSYRFYIANSTALEMIQRSNVGGSSISSVEDSGLFREWSEDSNHLMESSVVPITGTVPIKYTNTPIYIAPQKVYQTAWSVGPTKQSGQLYNFTWKVPVDLGFRYLIRLHFCELEYAIKDSGQREFCIIINKQIAEAYADIIKWSGGIGVAVFRDYVVKMDGDRMEGKRDIVITIRPHCHGRRSKNAIFASILNGIEVFKLSNLDNNLAGPNPESFADNWTSKAPITGKLPLSYKGVKVIANGLIIFLTLLNIVVHQLCIWEENSGKKTISRSSAKEICRHFSLSEIHLATNNFDDAFTISCGGFGKVYKGIINEGATIVAIKRLNSSSKQGAHEFWTEINMLSELRHTHLVTLIGYCNDRREMILVYEYMAHGTLADHLYKNRRNSNGIYSLTWEKRLGICIGAARGLNYLHTGTNVRVIQRDVKSTNILLDENWVAKISDFGLSKMGNTSQSGSHVSTIVKGTFGYLDPEYYSTHRLTRKSDVYAFGVVLFEVLCGRPAVDMKLEEEQRSLALWAQHCIREGIIHEIIDPHLKRRISPNCLKLFVEVAMKCLHNYSKDRPAMDDVVGSLELALAAQKSSSSWTEKEAIGHGFKLRYQSA